MTGPLPRASVYYSASVDRFLATEPHQVFGALAAANTHALEIEQCQAREEELDLLRTALSGLAGTLHLEFEVPRLGTRIDAVLITGPNVFPIEFKCGESQFQLGDYNQAWDYALDLKTSTRRVTRPPFFSSSSRPRQSRG